MSLRLVEVGARGRGHLVPCLCHWPWSQGHRVLRSLPVPLLSEQGLPTRALALVRLGASFYLNFWPLGLLVVVAFLTVYLVSRRSCPAVCCCESAWQSQSLFLCLHSIPQKSNICLLVLWRLSCLLCVGH